MHGVKPYKCFDNGEKKFALHETLGGGNQKSYNDFTVLFKRRCADLASDKIWLTQMKIWEIISNELVGDQANWVVIQTSEQVNKWKCLTALIFLFTLAINKFAIHPKTKFEGY